MPSSLDVKVNLPVDQSIVKSVGAARVSAAALVVVDEVDVALVSVLVAPQPTSPRPRVAASAAVRAPRAMSTPGLLLLLVMLVILSGCSR